MPCVIQPRFSGEFLPEIQSVLVTGRVPEERAFLEMTRMALPRSTQKSQISDFDTFNS